jgi:uncharacterized membrane protein YedE/YeeE
MTSALSVAVVLGIAFGAALEQAGLGNARKLIGQFYATDFSVFKVMFSAILTAMLGTFWLGRFGVIDFAALYIPESFLLPQLAGGLVFGVGFAVSGLCPGTACVAAASGRGDGWATMVGMFGGVALCALAFPAIATFYGSTALGVLTVPQWSGLPYGVVVLAIVLVALGFFRLIARHEARA